MVDTGHLHDQLGSALHGAEEGDHCLPVCFCSLAWSCQALWKCPGPGCMALGKSFLSLGLSLPICIMGRGLDHITKGFPELLCYGSD